MLTNFFNKTVEATPESSVGLVEEALMDISSDPASSFQDISAEGTSYLDVVADRFFGGPQDFAQNQQDADQQQSLDDIANNPQNSEIQRDAAQDIQETLSKAVDSITVEAAPKPDKVMKDRVGTEQRVENNVNTAETAMNDALQMAKDADKAMAVEGKEMAAKTAENDAMPGGGGLGGMAVNLASDLAITVTAGPAAGALFSAGRMAMQNLTKAPEGGGSFATHQNPTSSIPKPKSGRRGRQNDGYERRETPEATSYDVVAKQSTQQTASAMQTTQPEDVGRSLNQGDVELAGDSLKGVSMLAVVENSPEFKQLEELHDHNQDISDALDARSQNGVVATHENAGKVADMGSDMLDKAFNGNYQKPVLDGSMV